jgi:hypothetical protein
MAKRASSFTWETVPAAARRLGRNAGHLRKLVAGLAEQGKARTVKGGGRKPHWEIRSDVTMPDAHPAVEVEETVSLRYRSLVISIRGDCGINFKRGRLSIIDAASERSSSLDSAGFDGRLRTPRRPHKSGSKTRRTHPD